eukprot:scaffold43986_cov59-Phaeocystis_antarctica.AAC.5
MSSDTLPPTSSMFGWQMGVMKCTTPPAHKGCPAVRGARHGSSLFLRPAITREGGRRYCLLRAMPLRANRAIRATP